MNKTRHSWGGCLPLALVLAAYIIGQVAIGSYLPSDRTFHFDTPADIDFLYYAGILTQMKLAFPPQNPAYGGEILGQSFVQYYPTMVLSYLMNPYLAMRVANLIFLLLLAFVLRRYFPEGWGLGLAVIAAGSVGFGIINSLGIDLIARGFNHFPFFIALVVALFERQHRWVRYPCLFLLGWLHSFLALLSLVSLGIEAIRARFGRDEIIAVVLGLVGTGTAALVTLGTADKPFYFLFVEGFRLDLKDLWMHAVAAAVLILPTRNMRLYIWGAVALVFGALFHYNPFFPVFLLNFLAGLAAMALYRQGGWRRRGTIAATVLLAVGFAISALGKYGPEKGSYIPHVGLTYAAAGWWLQVNTPSDAVILTAPPEGPWQCRLMENRALYLGFIPHVAHLGIDWRNRAQKLTNYFSYPDVQTIEADFVVYGPEERRLFPMFRMRGEPAYRDAQVAIWKVTR